MMFDDIELAASLDDFLEANRCSAGEHHWQQQVGADNNVLVPIKFCANCGVMLVGEPVVLS